MYLAFSDCPYGAHSIHCETCLHWTDMVTGDWVVGTYLASTESWMFQGPGQVGLYELPTAFPKSTQK